MIIKSEQYSSQRIIDNLEKFRLKRLNQILKNIHNLNLNQQEFKKLIQRCLPQT